MKILKTIWQFLKEIWVESDPRKDVLKLKFDVRTRNLNRLRKRKSELITHGLQAR
jgi:hypothetical protein